MRPSTLVFTLALGGFAGWIVGSVYPAPQGLLAMVGMGGAGSEPAAAEAAPALEPAAAAPAPTVEAAPAAAPKAAIRPARSGPVDAGTLAQYRTWIHEARLKHPYPDSEERMYVVMMCESRGQARIVNPAGPYSGLFQYGAGTWRGAWNDYRDQDILDARTQIFATALAWKKGMQRQWGCYTRPH
jgi:hypothetical protein